MANSNDTSSGNGASPSQTSAQNQGSSKSFVASAQATLGDAYEATVGAVKEHPVAAAAIAAGTAAAVGGAVYAATQLRDSGSTSGGKSTKK